MLTRALFALSIARATMSSSAPTTAYYRADGVRITHNPYAAGMAEKYENAWRHGRRGL